MSIALHMTCHLARPVPGRLQKLLINDRHKPEVLGALTLRLSRFNSRSPPHKKTNTLYRHHQNT